MINEEKHQNRLKGITIKPYDLFVLNYAYLSSMVHGLCLYLSIGINSTHHAYYDIPSLDLSQLCIEPIPLEKFEANSAVPCEYQRCNIFWKFLMP